MNIKDIREKQNLKQITVAKDLNINAVTYNGYETGKSEPNIKTLIKLADYFDVSLDYLCNRQYNNNVGYIPDNKRDAIKKIIELSDKNFDKVEAYITALVDSEK